MYFFFGGGSFNRAQNWFPSNPVNAAGLPPTQMLLKNGQDRNVGGHDLFIDKVPKHMYCNSSLGGAYCCPPGQHFFLTGALNFRLDEMEVYWISM